MLTIGSPAPDFSLPDQDKKLHTLKDFSGRWLILYFYPKDDTPGCTIEACSFRDNSDDLEEAGITVVGISKDSVRSHRKFADKHQLPFLLLSDPSTEMIQAYGAWAKKKFWGREYDGILRNTILIDPDGIVRRIYENVNPLGHAGAILADVRELTSQR